MAHPPDGAAPPREKRTTFLIACGLVAAIALAYAGVLGCGFVRLDDTSHVFENPLVRGGLSLRGIATAFTTPHASLWVPLTTCSFMLDVSLWGLDARWFHLENVAWHAAATVLLFLALRRLTGRLWPSALVAALFALHPINVESVTWITERKNVLCAFFTMLSLLAWARFAQKGAAAAWVGSLVAFIAALLAKPMAVPLPAALLLLDAWPLERWRRCSAGRLIGEKLPFFAVAVAASRMAVWATHARDSIVDLHQLPLGARLSNALTSLAAYVRQILAPGDFAVIYPHPLVAHWPAALAALALLLGLTAAAWRIRRSQPWALVGWLFFCGMLVPSLGLVQVGSQARADRFTYLAQIGFFFALVWTADRLWPVRLARWRAPLAAALLVALASITSAQVAVWRDSVTLFEHSLSVTGPTPQTLDLSASAHAAAGKRDVAVARWRESLRLLPDNASAWHQLGRACVQTGDQTAALECFRRATALEPENREALTDFASLLERAGEQEKAALVRARLNP